MGRYAFFNTGFEYKFRFAVQSSQDIWDFGGEDKGETPDGYFKYEWNIDFDKIHILEILRAFEDDNYLPKMDFGKYEPNLHGTNQLYHSVWENHYPDILGDDEQAWYALGCIIYHQILYQPYLSCEYAL